MQSGKEYGAVHPGVCVDLRCAAAKGDFLDNNYQFFKFTDFRDFGFGTAQR
jgi:hypothetical protein